ncbi:MAG: hypothetical protein GY814_16895, partial [Gammaproteobacteria bacterium]|nr:hypothetical protein [Gammaproteobacteria bacterium]
QAKWTKQVEREDYHWDVDLSGNQLRPQLALDYTKVGHRVRWGNVVGQPKLDGCFSKDTKIITNKGSVNIADIRVGDKVMSLNETTGELEAKEVLNTFYNGKCGDFLSIVTERNKVRGKRSSALTVTPNHRVLINGEWGQVKDLKVGDSLSEVTDLIYKQKVMLGLLLGDGCLSSEKRLLPHSESLRVIYSQLEEKKPCIDFIGNLLGLDYNLHSRVSGYGSSTLTLTTKALTFNGFELNKLFDLNTDSSAYGKRKDIPYEYLKSYFDEIAFSLWYMGDGSIRYNNDNTNTPVMSISTHRYSSKQILDFQNLFRVKFNCTPTIIEDKRHKRQDGTYKSTLTFNTKDTLYLLNILKTYQIPSYDYKYYFKGDSSGFSSSGSVLEDDKVVAINPVKTVLGKYDIEVKDNHNYIANNRVVHNCRMLYGSKDKGGSGAEFITRKGETYNVEHLVEPCKSLLERINNGLPEGLVCLALDGEIYKHGLP